MNENILKLRRATRPGAHGICPEQKDSPSRREFRQHPETEESLSLPFLHPSRNQPAAENSISRHPSSRSIRRNEADCCRLFAATLLLLGVILQGSSLYVTRAEAMRGNARRLDSIQGQPIAVVFPRQFSTDQRIPMMDDLPPRPWRTRGKTHDKAPDYGGIDISRRKDHQQLHTQQRVDLEYEKHRYELLNSMDVKLRSKYQTHEDLQDDDRDCKDPEWTDRSFPTCNNVHEFAMERPLDDKARDQSHEVSYLSHGYYRDAFRFQRVDNPTPDSFVLKRYQLKNTFNARAKDLHAVHQEAMIMERLSTSSYILDIYGYCGTSVFVETMAQDLSKYIVPGSLYMTQEQVAAIDNSKPQNNLTASEKLQIGLSMAEALAGLHYHDGGIIVDADVDIEQWLLADDGSIKLNDFNAAYARQYNVKAQEYCLKEGKPGQGIGRSPEELSGMEQDESVDVFAFGNILYTLLTGLWFYYENGDKDLSTLRQEIINGRRPNIDEAYSNGRRSYVEIELVHTMKKCWDRDRTKRPCMTAIIEHLRMVKAEASKRGELEASSLINIPLAVK